VVVAVGAGSVTTLVVGADAGTEVVGVSSSGDGAAGTVSSGTELVGVVVEVSSPGDTWATASPAATRVSKAARRAVSSERGAIIRAEPAPSGNELAHG
jgi:hypothetical protein